MYCAVSSLETNLIKDIALLEKTQHQATKFIITDYTADYKTCVKKLNLLPLMYVRCRVKKLSKQQVVV